MIFYPISALINAIASSIVCLLAISKNPRSQLNRSFSYFAFSVSFWAYCYFFWQISDNATDALFWCRALMAGAVFIPSSFLHFSVTFIGRWREYLKVIMLWYAASVFFLFLDLTPFFVKGVGPQLFFPYWPSPGVAYAPFLIIFIGLTIYAHILMYKAYRRLSGLRRNQIKYVFLGTAIGFAGGSTNYFLWYNIQILPIGNVLVAVYVLLVAYAIIKHRLMDIKVAISRAGISLVVYSFAFGIPFYVGYITESWVFAVTVAVLLAVPSPWLYRYFSVRAENLLLAEQRRYQKILVQAAGGMVKEHSLGTLVKLIAYIVKKTVKIDFAAVFLKDDDEEAYILMAMRNKGGARKRITFAYDSPFIVYLKKQKEPILYEEMHLFVRKSIDFPLPVGLIVPAFSEDRLMGFLLLGEKLNHKLYSQDDINIFKILSSQASLAIENCLFFEEFKKAQNKIFEAEKLASIGGMADGVAHQIKNRLNHFSVACGEMKYEISDFMDNHKDLLGGSAELKKSLEYLTQIADSMVDSVIRTDGIIKGILNFARVGEKDKFFGQFSLKEVVKLSVDLLKVKHQVARAPVEEQLEVDTIWGVKAQIMEVVYNLLDNAYEATQEMTTYFETQEERHAYKAKIVIRSEETPHSYILTVSDNGVGMREKDKDKIFAPFFTTKSSYKSGTGIGMYIIKRIVDENHKGRVWFESKYKKGTTISIELPKKP